MIRANLKGAILHQANFSEADIREANLSNTDLYQANLYKSIVTMEQLNKAKSLKGATMPDGSIHP